MDPNLGMKGTNLLQTVTLDQSQLEGTSPPVDVDGNDPSACGRVLLEDADVCDLLMSCERVSV